MIFSKLMSDGARDNQDAMGFGYRYDDNWSKAKVELTGTGDATGNLVSLYTPDNMGGFLDKMTVGFKPLLGLFNQFKYIPLRFAPITLEFELVNNEAEVLISPSGTTTGLFTTVATGGDEPSNTSTLWELNNCFVNCDILSLDDSLNNAYIDHLNRGGELPITMTTYITQSQSIAGLKDINVQVLRSVSRLVAGFITFYKKPVAGTLTDGTYANNKFYVQREFNRFYHPMDNNDEALNGFYNYNLDLEFQIQLGNKLYPEYPCNSLSQCFYHLKKALNLPIFHQHSISTEFLEYKENHFIFAFDFQRVPEVAYSGINTRGNQQLLIKIKPLDSGIDVNNMPEHIYVTLLNEQIATVRDTSVELSE